MRIDASRPRWPRGASSRSLFERLISTLLLAVLLLSPGGLGLLPARALAAPIADPFAPVGFTPQILTTPNGVPLVHISAPNAAGLSLNRYQRLDVDPVGLIFNNSLVNGTSQLGGVLSANPNLSGQAARVILNEVRGPGSILAGPVEVFGTPATLIFANPNGITVNGARFINSPRVSLTTGAPLWLNGSALTNDFAGATGVAFDVSGSRITVDRLGVSAPGRLDLIAETLLIDGLVSAGDALNLIAGRQRVDDDSLAVGSNGALNAAAVRAIDATAFGAMTAGQIHILSTAQGMGVRSAANMAANAGGFTLSANGDLEIKDASAVGAMALSAQSNVSTSGNVSADSLALTTPGTWSHSGSIDTPGAVTINAGSVALNGAVSNGAALTLQANQLSSSANSVVLSAGDIRITAAKTDLAGTLLGDRQLIIDSSTFAHSGASQAARDIRIRGDTLANRGTLSAEGNFAMLGSTLSNAGGVIQGRDVALTLTGALDNSGGRLAALNDLTLHAATLTNDRGTPIVGVTHSQLYGASLLNSTVVGTRNGFAVTLGQLAPDYAGLTIGNTGVRLPLVDRTITGQREAVQGHIVAARNADIELSGALSNRGSTIEAGERLAIAATTLDQSARGDVRRTVSDQVSAAELARMAGELAPYRSALGLDTISPQADSHSSVQSLSGTLGQLLAGSALELTLESFANVGAVRSLGDVRVSVANAFSTQGSVVAQRDLAVSAGSLSNTGQLLAGRDGDIRVSGQLLNEAGVIETGRDLSIVAGSFINRRAPLTTRHLNYGDAAPANALNCRHEHGYCESTEQIESSGPAQVNAARHLSVSTQSFLNDASLLSAGGDLDLQAQLTVDNATRILTTTWHGHWREWRGTLRGYRNHDETGQSVTGQTPALIQAAGLLSVKAAKINNSGNLQGNSVYLGGDAITNGITDFSQQTPGSTIPDSGISLANSALFGSRGFSGNLSESLLFAPQASQDGSAFVYSGPPAPGNLTSLTQEDLLAALPDHLRPGGTNPPKFLLDPQAEARALRQAALEQTGRAYFINGLAYDDQLNASLDTQQRQLLYANAAQFASTYDIALGYALTAEQIGRLTQPILWYVEQQVTDAQGNSILAYVPTVYLPQVSQYQLANIAGGVIRGNDITLSTRSQDASTDRQSRIFNTGFITAARNLTLDTKELRNEKRSADIGDIHQAEEDGYFKLTGDTVQPGGFISAAALQIIADQVHSLSGEFQVLGENEADSQANSNAFLTSLRQSLGENFTEAINQDHIASEWVQVSKPDPWAQVAILVAAVIVSIYTAGAASGLVAGALSTGAGSTFAAAAVVGTETIAAGLGNVMLSAALTSMASATVTGALSGHLSLNDVLIAGATGAVTGFVGAQTGGWGMGSQNGQSVVTDWGAHAASVATRAGTSAAINQLRGGDFGDSFTNAMISSLAAEGSSLIGANTVQGSPLHVALHALVGGATAALQKQDILAGAIGEATSAYLTSKIDDPTDAIGNPREWSTNEKALMSAGAAIAGAVASAAAGRDALTGANGALNEVQNNRLLHRNEQVKLNSLVSRWKELGYASEEQARARLEIAACGMTLCAAQIPSGDATYGQAKAVQDLGASAWFERDRQLLSTTNTTRGSRDFIYDKFVEGGADAWSATNMNTRSLGLAQGVAGTLGIGGSLLTTPACATIFGCALPVAGAVISADIAYTGLKTMVYGETQTTMGAQVLSAATGLSPHTSELIYAGFAVTPAAIEGIVANRAANAYQEAQQFARSTYLPASEFLADARTQPVLNRVGELLPSRSTVVLSETEARRLGGENRGLIYIAETPRGQQAAQEFQAGASGAFSDLASQKLGVPALRYDNPNAPCANMT